MKISGMVLVGDSPEPYLTYCLESIESLVDEIVIIFPPESLQLVEEAIQAVGCQHKSVLSFQDGGDVDFSVWRNQSLDRVKGKYILWADADEIWANHDGSEVTRESIETLIKTHPKVENFLFPTLHFMWNYYTLDASGTNDHIHNCMRLFKNNGRRFTGRVHEWIPMDEKKTVMCNNPYIWHFGHCKGVEDLANKYRERHIADNPYTGKMTKEQFNNYLKVHNKLRGRLPTVRYDGKLPEVMSLW